MDAQAKLLRALQERKFERLGAGPTITSNFRLLAATNQNLEELVAEGRFREDLLYRLNVVKIEIPPLRARRGDIPALAEHFMRSAQGTRPEPPSGFSEEALRALMMHDYPGNVRELRNMIERHPPRAARVLLHRDHRRLVAHNAFALHIDEGIRRAQIDGEIVGEPAKYGIEYHKIDFRTAPETGSPSPRLRAVKGIFRRPTTTKKLHSGSDSKLEAEEGIAMAYPFRAILSPIELDDPSLPALGLARSIAKDQGAMLHLLHVVAMASAFGEPAISATLHSRAEEKAIQALNGIAANHLASATQSTRASPHTRVLRE